MALPLDVLEKAMNQKLSLLLKDGRVIEGKLTGYDEYMNMVLNEVEETFEQNKRRLGTVILRGNNVVSISILWYPLAKSIYMRFSYLLLEGIGLVVFVRVHPIPS